MPGTGLGTGDNEYWIPNDSEWTPEPEGKRALGASQKMRDDDSLHLNSENEVVVRGRSLIFSFIESSSSKIDSANGLH